MIRVVIVDDHPIVRAGIRAVMQTHADMCLLAEGDSGEQALRLVAKHRPDVLVLDVNLPDINGLEVARRVCQQYPGTAVLILTAHHDRQLVLALLTCGAVGYVLKDEALETLPHAVRAAAKRQAWLSPKVASTLVQAAMGQTAPQPPPPHASLTPAELQVLRLLAQGLDNAAIAQRLVVAKRTVQNHVSNLYSKLGVSSRSEAMLYAMRAGLVEAPHADSISPNR